MLATLIEAQVAGATELFPVRLLWERAPGAARELPGKAAIAIVLSGAQGEDDGARAGHLGIATGTFGPRGEWSQWLVDNFYPLDRRGAKGIIPATVPMDNYLLDVNSGQLYYRPAYMLVAVLRAPRAALAVHAALHETLVRLYCGDVEFHVSRNNSTAMSVDTLRSLGWRVPPTGPSSRVLAVLGFPAAIIAAGRFGAGRDWFSAMAAEKTRLIPRVAFEVIGHDLLYLAAGGGERDLSAFEQALVDDLDALLFVRLPQVPSGRAAGTYPVRSLFTYGTELHADPTGYQRAPQMPPTELPEGLEATCRELATPRNAVRILPE